MSSHHFVKEGQEPALFILDPVPFELAGPFLEWAPLVLVFEHALDHVLQWGIKIDVVFTDNQGELPTTLKTTSQVPVEIIPIKSEESLISYAFQYLIDRKQSGVNILTTRPEDVFSHAENVMKSLQVNIADTSLRWSGISTGRFEKWMMVKSAISIRKSMDSQPMLLQGLAERDGRLESTHEGLVSIRSDSFFWVAETHT